MKRYLFFLSIVILSCNDDNNSLPPENADPVFHLEYIDRALSGVIEGDSFVIQIGSANNDLPPQFESLISHDMIMLDSTFEISDCFNKVVKTNQKIVFFGMLDSDTIIPERKIFLNEEYDVVNANNKKPYFTIFPNGTNNLQNGFDQVFFDTGYVETKFLNNNFDSLEIKCVVGLERDLANNHIIGKFRLRYCNVL